jgi:hypothetical protein
MRLNQYYKWWNTIYESNVEDRIDEVIDLSTKVDRISDNEWCFWIGTDLYIVRIGKRGKDHYELSFVHKDIESKEETSNVVDKLTPFSVMDGVVVVMKKVIEEKQPRIIEFSVFGDKKKYDMFKKIMSHIMKKFKDIFGIYKVKESTANFPVYGTLPDELKNLKGIKFELTRI